MTVAMEAVVEVQATMTKSVSQTCESKKLVISSILVASTSLIRNKKKKMRLKNPQGLFCPAEIVANSRGNKNCCLLPTCKLKTHPLWNHSPLLLLVQVNENLSCEMWNHFSTTYFVTPFLFLYHSRLQYIQKVSFFHLFASENYGKCLF